jgi:hypothetical protein
MIVVVIEKLTQVDINVVYLIDVVDTNYIQNSVVADIQWVEEVQVDLVLLGRKVLSYISKKVVRKRK